MSPVDNSNFCRLSSTKLKLWFHLAGAGRSWESCREQSIRRPARDATGLSTSAHSPLHLCSTVHTLNMAPKIVLHHLQTSRSERFCESQRQVWGDHHQLSARSLATRGVGAGIRCQGLRPPAFTGRPSRTQTSDPFRQGMSLPRYASINQTSLLTRQAPALELDGKLITESGFIAHKLISSFPNDSVEQSASDHSTFWSHFSEGSLMTQLQMGIVLASTTGAVAHGQMPGVDMSEEGRKSVGQYGKILMVCTCAGHSLGEGCGPLDRPADEKGCHGSAKQQQLPRAGTHHSLKLLVYTSADWSSRSRSSFRPTSISPVTTNQERATSVSSLPSLTISTGPLTSPVHDVLPRQFARRWIPKRHGLQNRSQHEEVVGTSHGPSSLQKGNGQAAARRGGADRLQVQDLVTAPKISEHESCELHCLLCYAQVQGPSRDSTTWSSSRGLRMPVAVSK